MAGERILHVRYEHGGEEHHRTFTDKFQAYRWFHYQCPADMGTVIEEVDGVQSPPKSLRKKGRQGEF